MAMLAFASPKCLTQRWNFRWNCEFFVRDAAHPAWTSAARRNLFAFLIRPFLLLPAERLFPGQMPTQLHSFLAVSKGVMSAPTSARIAAAVISLTPGMVCTN